MKTLPWAAAVAAAVLSGCATSPETLSCMQPNRRVEVEVGGTKAAPPPKKAGAKPGRPQSVMHKALAQGDAAWDFGGATLKAGGKSDLDKLVKTVNQGTSRDKRPTKVSSVIITGHAGKYEAADGKTDLDEQRARAVRDYLASKGLDQKTMFWQGRDAEDPVAVTRFCED